MPIRVKTHPHQPGEVFRTYASSFGLAKLRVRYQRAELRPLKDRFLYPVPETVIYRKLYVETHELPSSRAFTSLLRKALHFIFLGGLHS